MARFVFFSFAYDDVKNFKVNVVRQNWVTKYQDETFIDGSIWEKKQLKRPDAIINVIENGLHNTSVTVVLIGEATANRRWVNYEIVKSFDKGNGILGININKIKGLVGLTAKGRNPLDRLGFQISEDGKKIYFYELIDGKWLTFKDLPEISNKKSNTLHFENGWFSNDFGKFFRFSEHFHTYCWVIDKGNDNIASWVETAAKQAGR